MSGVPVRRAKFVAYRALGPARGHGRAVPDLFHLFRARLRRQRQHLHALSRSPPSCSAACRCSAASGSAIGAIFGALVFRTIGDLLFVFDLDPLWQPLFQGVILLLAVASARSGCSGSGTVLTSSDERRRAAEHRLRTLIRARRSGRRDGLRLHHRAAVSRQPLFDELSLPRVSASAVENRLVPRGDRHRHDDRHPARPDRSLGALGGGGRRHDVRGGRGLMGSGRWGDCDPVRHPLRRRARTHQRLRCRLSAHPVDDHHACRQCGGSRHDGGPYGGFSPQDASSAPCASSPREPPCSASPMLSLVWIVLGAAAVFLLTRTTFGRAVYAIGNSERASISRA